MKILLLVIAAVFCLGLAGAGKEKKMNAHLRKHAAALHTYKRLKDMEAKGELENAGNAQREESGDKKERGYGYGCHGVSCDCWDFGLIYAYLGEMGNLMLTCQTDYLVNLGDDATAGKKRDGNEGRLGIYDNTFYNTTCYYLLSIAEYYHYHYPDDVYVITPCCQYEWWLLEAYCLNAYMTVAELHTLEDDHKANNNSFFKSYLVEDMEYYMVSMCDSLFYNANCLTAEFFYDEEEYEICYGDDEQEEESASGEESATESPAEEESATESPAEEDDSDTTTTSTTDSAGSSNAAAASASSTSARRRKLTEKQMEDFKSVLQNLLAKQNLNKRR